MAALRIPEVIFDRIQSHLLDRPGEHFAFMLARWTFSNKHPVFMIHEAILVPDSVSSFSSHGWQMATEAILDAINMAVRSGSVLIEAHNHGGSYPRFSPVDRDGLDEFVPYVLSSLPECPYAATVWGDSEVYGECFLPDGSSAVIERITVVGSRIRQVVSIDADCGVAEQERYKRQSPWFTVGGQNALRRLRVSVVGAGGTGSLVIQSLAYLGVGEFVIVDNDVADSTNLNRLVTAAPADVGIPKAELASRLIQRVAPGAKTTAIRKALQSRVAIEALKDSDVLFGCVDNDGARLILNELALAYGIPLIDVAVGIDTSEGLVESAGARIAVVHPGGPCLLCMDEIDQEEASYFLSKPEEQARNVALGYVRGMDAPAPAVISLNGAASAAAVNEFIMFVTGTRLVNEYTEIDLIGVARPVKAQWAGPRRVQRKHGCVQCGVSMKGDEAFVERYVL